MTGLALSSPEDKLFFSKASELLDKAAYRCQPTFTDFADPRKIDITVGLLQSTLNAAEVAIKAYGGLFDCERAVIGFFPYFQDENLFIDGQLLDEQFPIIRIKISYDEKYINRLTHRDFLGALMGLSIGREKMGDIIVQNGYSYVLAKSEVSGFIIDNLFAVGSVPVSCAECQFMEINAPVNESKSITVTAASTRLDGIISHCFNIPRSKAADAIRKGKILVNWTVAKNSSLNINPGDTISFRGNGRIKIISMSENKHASTTICIQVQNN